MARRHDGDIDHGIALVVNAAEISLARLRVPRG